jgi:hypothetical protein
MQSLRENLLNEEKGKGIHPIEESTIRRLEGCHVTRDNLQIFEASFLGLGLNEFLRNVA